MRELPLVDETLCTACGDCTKICPVDCLEMGTHLPWLIRPAACIACAACQFVCPVGAIMVK